VTQRDIIASPVVAAKAPVLAEAALVIADSQVRYVGTIGGNVANGDPGNDMPAVMMCLGASYRLVGRAGERSVPARDFAALRRPVRAGAQSGEPCGARTLSGEDLNMDRVPDVLELVPSLKAKGEAFALATVVRTVAATAAKAGAKAIVRADGAISEGWIGGGCARSAVIKAARAAIVDGKARLISVQPPDVLQQRGVAVGEEREGVRFAKSTCPSHGTIYIFIEPVLPRPQLILCGSSPVAVAVADLARRLGFSVTVCAPRAEQDAFAKAERRIDGYSPPVSEEGERFIVVATQSKATRMRSKAPSPPMHHTSTSDDWRRCVRPPGSISGPWGLRRSRSRSWLRSWRSGAGAIRGGLARRGLALAVEVVSASAARI
jgi:xanthine dehydrogenase accessory factor